MMEPPTPPPDECATFRRLAERLVAVPKKELDEKRAAERQRRNGRLSSGKRGRRRRA